MLSNTNRHAIVENARRVAAEYVAAAVSLADIQAMLDGYLPVELARMVGFESVAITEGQALYMKAGIEEAKRLRNVDKSAK